LKIDWDGGANASYNSPAYRAAMEASVKAGGSEVLARGDVAKAFAAAAKTLEATYCAPMLSQPPMEPPAANTDHQSTTSTPGDRSPGGTAR
jgi:isoquinoline 1-oxidoreductase beta subunit